MKHYDCKYYLAIDAFKGICKRTKENIIADDAACESFETAQKCKHCHNYTVSETDLGLCMNKFNAYPEMNALNCNDFKLS